MINYGIEPYQNPGPLATYNFSPLRSVAPLHYPQRKSMLQIFVVKHHICQRNYALYYHCSRLFVSFGRIFHKTPLNHKQFCVATTRDENLFFSAVGKMFPLPSWLIQTQSQRHSCWELTAMTDGACRVRKIINSNWTLKKWDKIRISKIRRCVSMQKKFYSCSACIKMQRIVMIAGKSKLSAIFCVSTQGRPPSS